MNPLEKVSDYMEYRRDISMQSIIEREDPKEIGGWIVTHVVKSYAYFGSAALLATQFIDRLESKHDKQMVFASSMMLAGLGLREVFKTKIYFDEKDRIESKK